MSSSPLRELLAAAQRAEIRGDRAEAARLSRQAAEFFRDRGLARRALQMLRHVRRLEGVADSDLEEALVPLSGGIEAEPLGDDALAAVLQTDGGLGFGDELLEGLALPDRGPQRADPAVDAWCSFCCRPRAEVGPLVAGPAGAFLCAQCLQAAAALFEARESAGARPLQPPAARRLVDLPSQRVARELLELRQPRVALVVGPEGSGKSAFLGTLGTPVEPPLDALHQDTALVDLSQALSAADEARLLRWLAERPARRLILAARGSTPRPVLVLHGDRGEAPVYDTDALHEAVQRQVSVRVLATVEVVLPLEPPDRAALLDLGRSLLGARDLELPDDALEQLVALAERSGRGAHELTALLARIPAGRYQGR